MKGNICGLYSDELKFFISDRTPKLTLFIFSLPHCELLQSIDLPDSLERDEMDQRFLLKDYKMMFLFHDQEFFNNMFLASKWSYS